MRPARPACADGSDAARRLRACRRERTGRFRRRCDRECAPAEARGRLPSSAQGAHKIAAAIRQARPFPRSRRGRRLRTIHPACVRGYGRATRRPARAPDRAAPPIAGYPAARCPSRAESPARTAPRAARADPRPARSPQSAHARAARRSSAARGRGRIASESRYRAVEARGSLRAAPRCAGRWPRLPAAPFPVRLVKGHRRRRPFRRPNRCRAGAARASRLRAGRRRPRRAVLRRDIRAPSRRRRKRGQTRRLRHTAQPDRNGNWR